jgi:trans-aconitate methyltransferase
MILFFPRPNSAKENVMPSAPSGYAFKDERTQVDLLSRIPKIAPRRVADLGCGPGYSTELIARFYPRPRAEIIGVDHSENALQTARALLPGIQFEQFDIGQGTPDEPYDLIFSNGALQWLPNHRNLLSKLLSSVEKGGFLALQIPNNLQEPNRFLFRMVAADGPWAAKLLPIAKSEPNTKAYEDLYGPVRVATGSMGYKHKRTDIAAVSAALAAPNFLLKIIPDVDGTLRICELVEYYLEDITVKGGLDWAGRA